MYVKITDEGKSEFTIRRNANGMLVINNLVVCKDKEAVKRWSLNWFIPFIHTEIAFYKDEGHPEPDQSTVFAPDSDEFWQELDDYLKLL